MMLVLLGCDTDECAAECSFPLDMLRKFADVAVCQGCYEDGAYGKERWEDLPVIMPSDLCFYFPNAQPPEFVAYMEAQVDLLQKVDDLFNLMVRQEQEDEPSSFCGASE